MRSLAAAFSLLLVALAVSPATAQTNPPWRHLSSASGNLPAPGPSDQQTGSLVADVNQDGVQDFFLVARVVGPAVTLYLRTETSWTKHIVEPDFLRIEAGGAAHDIDGDGDLDIVFGADAGDNHMWWWENPHPDHTQRWKRHTIKATGGPKHHDQLFGDFDQDDQTELVSWNQGDHALLLFEIPENPRQADHWPATTIYEWEGQEHEGLAAADVNGDGSADIIGGGRWFEHTGGARFTPHVIDDDARFTRAAAAQLVEGGPPEIIFGPGDLDGPLRWYQEVEAEWVRHDLPIPDLVHGHSLAVGDINQDGHTDIFSAEMGQWGSREDRQNPRATIRILLGDGAGNFEEQVLSVGVGNHESRLADLDGDGDLDILAKPYNWQTPRIDIYLNPQAR